jgi:D-serine dehydratase
MSKEKHMDESNYRPAFDDGAAHATLAELAALPLTALDKGFSGLSAGRRTPDAIVAGALRLDDPAFSTPEMVLRSTALDANISAMAAFAQRAGALLAPHAKTTMSPEIFVRQLRAGAWALTAANVTQAAIFSRFGARRILIANELTDAAELGTLTRLLADLPELELCVYVDSLAGVDLLDRTLTDAAPGGQDRQRRLPVLVEVGLQGGRAGVRSRELGIAVARAAAMTSTLSVVGASCFEGVIGHETDEATLARVADFCGQVRMLGESIAGLGLLRGGFGTPDDTPSLILSAGGSHYFDVVAAEFARSAVPHTRIVIRSGSYVTHDHGTYLHSSPMTRLNGLPEFRPAIEVRTSVLSRPEPGLLLLNAGRRDVSFDAGLPVVLGATRKGLAVGVADAHVTALNDQHAFVTVPVDSELAVGDLVVLGISHPCTTFDKWQHALIVDDDDRVVEVAHTFF